jgi:hypothetical protein
MVFIRFLIETAGPWNSGRKCVSGKFHARIRSVRDERATWRRSDAIGRCTFSSVKSAGWAYCDADEVCDPVGSPGCKRLVPRRAVCETDAMQSHLKDGISGAEAPYPGPQECQSHQSVLAGRPAESGRSVSDRPEPGWRRGPASPIERRPEARAQPRMSRAGLPPVAAVLQARWRYHPPADPADLRNRLRSWRQHLFRS